MNKSESLKELASALAKAQGEMPAVKMNSVNPFLKNRYADLGAVIETARPVLARHGLAISQHVFAENGMVGVETLIMHQSGEWLQSIISLPLTEEKGKSAAQAAGSVITYLRRYALSSALGMYADQDEDGNAPQTPQKPVQTPSKPSQTPASMTLDEALSMTGSDGIRYGERTTEHLSAIAKNAHAPTEKRYAAQLIIDSRTAAAAE